MTPKHREVHRIGIPDLYIEEGMSSRQTAVRLDDTLDLVAISSYSA